MAPIQEVPSKLFIRLNEKSDAGRETDKEPWEDRGEGKEGRRLNLKSYKVFDAGCYNFSSLSTLTSNSLSALGGTPELPLSELQL